MLTIKMKLKSAKVNEIIEKIRIEQVNYNI
jgi:hypothetical protein